MGKKRLVMKDETTGEEYLDPRFYYDPAEDAVFITGVSVRYGDGTDESDGFPEGMWSQGNKKHFNQEGLIAGSKDDSIDIGLGRAGNDGAPGAPMTTLPTQRLAWIYGRSYVAPPAGLDPWRGWTGGTENNQFSFSAGFDFQTDGPQTFTSRPGALGVYLTRPGQYAGERVAEFRHQVAPGDTFMSLVYLDGGGNLRMAKVARSSQGYLYFRDAGTPPPLEEPTPPAEPPQGSYRFIRLEISKIVTGNIDFRLVDFQLSADGGNTWVPQMTSNTAPSPFSVSASTETTSDPAWEGVDGNIASTIWRTSQVADASGNFSPTAHITIDFGEGNGLSPNLLRYWPYVYNGDRTIVNGRLLGSTTGAFAGEETILLTIANETSKPHSQPVTYTI